jgi:hypothetical protein
MIGRQGSTASGRSTAAAALVVSALPWRAVPCRPRVRAAGWPTASCQSPAAALPAPRLPGSDSDAQRQRARARPCSNRRGREGDAARAGGGGQHTQARGQGSNYPWSPRRDAAEGRHLRGSQNPEACCRVLLT